MLDSASPVNLTSSEVIKTGTTPTALALPRFPRPRGLPLAPLPLLGKTALARSSKSFRSSSIDSSSSDSRAFFDFSRNAF